MTTQQVSVLVPCHNAERFVDEAIESALAQTHPAVEVVCVDDGSTDGTLKHLEAWGDRVVLDSGPNRGGPVARNRALELSRGEFIQYLDADDVLLPEKLERQLPPLVAGEADLVFCNKRVIGSDGVLRERPSPPSPEGVDPVVYCLENALPGVAGHIITGQPLHRRSCLEAVGGFREGVPLSQDKELLLRLAAAGVRLSYVDAVLFTYRDHPGPRVSRQARPASWPAIVLMEIAEIVLSGPPYRVSEAGRSALARQLFALSIEAWREDPALGARGLRMAGRISADHLAATGPGYRAVARLLGATNTERLLRLAVRSKSRRRRFRRVPARAARPVS